TVGVAQGRRGTKLACGTRAGQPFTGAHYISRVRVLSPLPEAAQARRRTLFLFAGLAVANIAAWVWALAAFRQYPLLLGTALLAYGLGLRHAIDADHIAAIDNVTRKLMQTGERPVASGFFFSLGHSTVVVLATLAIAATATAFGADFGGLRDVGGIIGT